VQPTKSAKIGGREAKCSSGSVSLPHKQTRAKESMQRTGGFLTMKEKRSVKITQKREEKLRFWYQWKRRNDENDPSKSRAANERWKFSRLK